MWKCDLHGTTWRRLHETTLNLKMRLNSPTLYRPHECDWKYVYMRPAAWGDLSVNSRPKRLLRDVHVRFDCGAHAKHLSRLGPRMMFSMSLSEDPVEALVRSFWWDPLSEILHEDCRGACMKALSGWSSEVLDEDPVKSSRRSFLYRFVPVIRHSVASFDKNKCLLQNGHCLAWSVTASIISVACIF